MKKRNHSRRKLSLARETIHRLHDLERVNGGTLKSVFRPRMCKIIKETETWTDSCEMICPDW